jgi:hypothetical protein
MQETESLVEETKIPPSTSIRIRTENGETKNQFRHFKVILIVLAVSFLTIVVLCLFNQSMQNLSTLSTSSSFIGSNGTELTNKQIQIQNYKRGKSLIGNVHITHHAGTTMCNAMRQAGKSPDFACISSKSWSYQDTAINVEAIRPYFHFISQEYKNWGDLHKTNWEYNHLVSMIVMKHPIDRFLSGGKCGEFHALIVGDPSNSTQDLYWKYANSGCADNYALRVLANTSSCVNGTDTPLACLEGAKVLLRRFTYIMDAECFDDSLRALSDELELNITKIREQGKHTNQYNEEHRRERIGNATLYKFLQTRFRRDIELYEWSKAQSIVKCKSLG